MKHNSLSASTRRLRTTGRITVAAALSFGVVSVAGAPTVSGQAADPTTCVPGDSFLFDWGDVDWDDSPTFPYTETVTDVAGSGVDATITITNEPSQPISFRPQFPFPELVPYFGDADTLRYWQNRTPDISPVTISFSEPVVLDEIGSGGSRFLGGTHGGTAFRAYTGPDGTGSVVLPDPTVHPDPSVVAIVEQGDPLPGTAPINQIAPPTNLNVAYDPSDDSFLNVGQTGTIGWTIYDYESMVVQSFVWELFGSTVDDPLTARDNLTTPLFNSAYLSGFRFETCAPPTPVSIGSFVWIDENDDGLQTAGEPGLAGATLELLVDDGSGTFVPATDLAGATVASQVTAADGTYLFDGLPAGDYRVEVTPPQGYVPTAPQVNADDGTEDDSNIAGGGGVAGTYVSPTITLAPGTEPIESGAQAGDDQDAAADDDGDMTIDFGFVEDEFPVVELYEVGNQLWQDRDNSGDIDPGEPTFGAGVIVTLLDDEGNEVGRTETDADGRYIFSSLLPGAYSVCLPAANFEAGGELAGWHVSTGPASSSNPDDGVDNNNDGVEQTDGSVCSGTVTLVGDQPTDETDESPTGTPNNRSNLTVDFGFYQLWVGDLVWFDTDNDGLKDPSESPAAGVAMELRNADGTVLATTVTNADGLYRFSGLAEGSYVVAVVASNFADGGVLEGFTSSTGNNGPDGLAPDPNDNVDDDDNGNPAADGGIAAAPIDLAAGEEPAEQGVGNPTVDFGVIEPPTPGSTVPTTSQPPVVTLPETGAGGVATMSVMSVLLMLLGGGLLLLTARRPRRS